MATCLTLAQPETESGAVHRQPRGDALVAWLALLLILAVGVPLFLCMPLWWDVLHYDFCARALLHGGRLYRDAFDNNLPGMTWMQAAVRGVVGWRPEMLRLADLVILGLASTLFLRWVPTAGSGRARVWTAAALAAFYLSTPEICHCQRDGWLLLPAVVALTLRDRQLRRLVSGGGAVFRLALLEGLCWGAALWIKPFIAIPALACWVMGAVCIRSQRGKPELLRLLRDAGGLLTGGLLAGALGLAWLAWSGSWNEFWEILLVWEREYADYARRRFKRLDQLQHHFDAFFPWSLIHVPALVIAAWAILRTASGRARVVEGARSQAMLAAFYLGLLFQALFAQLPHDYVLISTLLPAIVLFAAYFQPVGSTLCGGVFAVFFILFTAIVTHSLERDRLACWGHCVREGSTPQLRERLALNGDSWGAADWVDLARTADYLRSQSVRDGELTCLTGGTHWLFLELGLKPATRFDVLGVMAYFFPGHAEQIRKELDQSRTRYVVSDLKEPNLLAGPLHEARDEPPTLPPAFPSDKLGTFPWNQTLVFRSGRYVVHRVQGPVQEIWWSKNPLTE